MQKGKQPLLDRLERRFGRYAIKDLMKYVSIAYIIGTIIYLVSGATGLNFYDAYLSLDFEKIFHGQIWRIITFMIMPPRTLNGGFDILWIGVEIYMYFIIGRQIENAIGAFKFNCYFFCGVILNILAGLILFIISGVSGDIGVYYINRSMLLTFALLYPDVQFLLFFILPIKSKWIAIFDGVIIGFDFVRYLRISAEFMNQGYSYAALYYFAFALSILMSILNFVIFFFALKKRTAIPRQMRQRSKQYNSRMKAARENASVDKNGARHKCCICGRTELDDPDLQFRYCSKCSGNHEYCSDHLFSHEHIK